MRTAVRRPDMVRFSGPAHAPLLPHHTSSFSFGPGPISTALKALIAANVVMFLVTAFAPMGASRCSGWVPAFVVHQFWVWQLATYMFLHGGIFHILFNMLALWMFGTELERIWGTRYFLKFYFVTGHRRRRR